MQESEPMWHALGGVSKDAYEWLYFDVLNTTDGTHVSIDFLAPNPFDPRAANPNIDPRDRVGVIACISRAKQAGIEIDFVADHTQLEYSGDTLAIGGSSVTRRAAGGGLPVFDLQIDATAVDGSGRRITGKLTFAALAPEWSISASQYPGWGRRSGQYYEALNDPTRYHRWVVHAPRARATGRLSVDGPERLDLDIDGHGYHDHNLGTVALAATVQRWFWARGHDQKHTVIAAHLVPRAALRGDRWLDNVLYVGTDARNIAGAVGNQCVFTEQDPKQGGNSVPYAGLVSLETRDLAGQPVEVSFAHKEMAIDGHPGYLRRFVDVSLTLGPEAPSVFPAVAEDIVFP